MKTEKEYNYKIVCFIGSQTMLNKTIDDYMDRHEHKPKPHFEY